MAGYQSGKDKNTPCVHQGSFSLPGSSNEVGQSHTLRDVPLHHTLLLISVGRLEQSPLTLPCLCWDQGGAADQAVLVLLQSKRDLRLLFSCAEDKQRGEDVRTEVQDLSSWNCLREEQRSMQSTSTAFRHHGAASSEAATGCWEEES